MTAEPEYIQVRVAWIGVDETPIQFVNQVLAQFSENEFIVTLGQIAPPVMLGDEQERREQAESLEYIPVTPVARLALTPAGMRDLVQVLSSNLETYEGKEARGQ